MTETEYKEIAYISIQKARDLITEIFYVNREPNPNLTANEFRILSDMDYILRGGLGNNKNIQKYPLAMPK